jgi:hypothetical protein
MTDHNFTNDRYESAEFARVTGLASGLRRLHDLDDYEVAEGNSDVRGWEVRTPDGQILGKVDDLIVSVAELRVRYLDIDVEGGGHALVPIEAAQLDERHDDVLVSDLSVIRRNYDRNLATGGAVASGTAPDRIDTREAGFVDRNPREAPLERRPLDRQHVDASTLDSDREIRVPLLREEATVEKRPVVREEIVIRRRLVRENAPVEADLRREHIEVEGPAGSTKSPRANP